MQTNWARVKLILLETFIKNFWGFSASFVLLLLLLFSSFLWNTYMYLIYVFINITSIIPTYLYSMPNSPAPLCILRNLIHRLPGNVFLHFLPNFDDSSMKPLDPLMRQVNTDLAQPCLAHDENMYT